MRVTVDHHRHAIRRNLRPVRRGQAARSGFEGPFGCGFNLVGSRTGARLQADPPVRPRPAPARGLHVVDATMFWSVSGGGVGRYVRAKHAWLAAQEGWRHTAVVPRSDEAGCVPCGGVALPGSGGYFLPLGRERVARAIAAQRPDIVEAGDPYQMAWAALDAARRLHVPAVMFCHSNLPALASRWAGGRHSRGVLARWAHDAARAYLLRTCRQFDLVLAPSESMTRELRQMGVSGVQHQPLGVDTRIFNPQARDPAWRQALGLPPDARLLLYAGRFAPEKNLPVLARAVRRLGPRYWLLAIGAGPQPPAGERVRVLPYERDAACLARVMASVDGFVHAGDQETFGLSLLEAMACGTPVAARHAGGLAELLAGDAGMPVMSGRVDEWAEAMHALFGRHRSHWVAAGLARAQAHDWDTVLAALQRRYQRLQRGDELRAGELALPDMLQGWS
jgi:alpha-1,6-mannosyltransferase